MATKLTLQPDKVTIAMVLRHPQTYGASASDRQEGLRAGLGTEAVRVSFRFYEDLSGQLLTFVNIVFVPLQILISSIPQFLGCWARITQPPPIAWIANGWLQELTNSSRIRKPSPPLTLSIDG